MSGNSWAWFDAADDHVAKVQSIAKHPVPVAMVAAAVRGRRRSTPRVRVMCGGHYSGASLRLSIMDESIRLTWEKGAPVSTFSLVAASDGAPVRLTCEGCGRQTARASHLVFVHAIVTVDRWRQNPKGEMPAFPWDQNNGHRW